MSWAMAGALGGRLAYRRAKFVRTASLDTGSYNARLTTSAAILASSRRNAQFSLHNGGIAYPLRFFMYAPPRSGRSTNSAGMPRYPPSTATEENWVITRSAAQQRLVTSAYVVTSTTWAAAPSRPAYRPRTYSASRGWARNSRRDSACRRAGRI